MSLLPYACIPVLILIYLGSFVAFVWLDRHSLRRYYRTAKQSCRNWGWDIRDDPNPDGNVIIHGELEKVSFSSDVSRLELDNQFKDSGYRPVVRVIFEGAEEPGWLLMTPLQTHIGEHITSPKIPGRNWPIVQTNDPDFDRAFELRQERGQWPAFAKLDWFRRILKNLHLECAFSVQDKTVVLFLDRGLRDGTSDWHILAKRICTARILAGTAGAMKYRPRLEAPVPADEDWSLVPLGAMFLSLIPAISGSVFLDFPAMWMGAVTGAALGWPLSLLLTVLGTWHWFRHKRSRGHRASRGGSP